MKGDLHFIPCLQGSVEWKGKKKLVSVHLRMLAATSGVQKWVGQSPVFWAELFLDGSLWPQVVFPKRELGNSGTKLWPWIPRGLIGTWVCLEATESLQKTGISKWFGPMPTYSQTGALETAPTQDHHAGEAASPEPRGGRLPPTSPHSWCQLSAWHPCLLVSSTLTAC